MNGFLVGGVASSVGKTTVSLAIVAGRRRRGLTVQAFKGGPDFLDTSHLTQISGRPARNVDTWMLPKSANLEVVANAAAGANLFLVEGMMGLFDGKSGDSDVGSSAEIAKLLKIPVVLVLDASKSARSIAAVVLGFERFDPNLILAGVILNRVASERHFALLEAAIKDRCASPILGWLPREPAVAIPERHLGLHAAGKRSDSDLEARIDAFATLAETHLDLDAIAGLQCGLELGRSSTRPQVKEQTVRVGIARDEAFSFYYEDNLDLLKEGGATLVPFSPLNDSKLPEHLDALYFGGGYPELHASRLSENSSMLASVSAFAATGAPIYAECGGMVYLARTISDADDVIHHMAGVLPLEVQMTAKLVQFGYVTVTLTRDCLLGPSGLVVRGHSFHYSRIVNEPKLTRNYRVQYSLSGKEEAEGFGEGNVLASYIHVHFRTGPSVVKHLVQAARQARAAHLVTA